MTTLFDGTFTYREAKQNGLDGRDLARLCAQGELVRPHIGVYVPAHLAGNLDARVEAIKHVLPPGAAVARESAPGFSAWTSGLPVDGSHRPSWSAWFPLRAVRPQRPDINAFISDLPPGDVFMVNGVPCTTPTRTALDLARWRPRFIGLGAVDALAHAGLTTVVDLEQAARPLVGQRFIRRAREVISLCEPATESLPESWCRLRLIEAGFPGRLFRSASVTRTAERFKLTALGLANDPALGDMGLAGAANDPAVGKGGYWRVLRRLSGLGVTLGA